MVGLLSIAIGILGLFANTWMLQTGYNITFLKFFPEQLPVLSYYQVMALYIVIGMVRTTSVTDTKLAMELNSDERDLLNLSRSVVTVIKNALILFMTWALVGLAGL